MANDIQTKFDNEYLTFLTTITTNPPNIKKYAKDNFKSLKAISNHKKLSLNEKKTSTNVFQNLQTNQTI